ncbi:hypothetical protein [Halopelagius longus]|uniref:hypothetical protein n=1 Tax=Halopelagius longus TaxID=1236180 RepID=UPI00111447C4|nr:hypothetical protein [Halopelagius longus]
MSKPAPCDGEAVVRNEADDLREWAQGYNEPVVEKKGGGQKRIHNPDLDADEPVPDCRSATISDDAT